MTELQYEIRVRFDVGKDDHSEIIESWTVQEGDEDHQYITALLDGMMSMWDIAETVARGTGLDYRDVSEVEIMQVYGKFL